MEAIVAQVNYEKIKYEGIHCSPNCPNLKNGLCNVFSRALDEPPKSLGFPKIRLKACIDAQELARKIITEMIED